MGSGSAASPRAPRDAELRSESETHMDYATFAQGTFVNMLGTLDRLAAAAEEAGIGEEALSLRLADDMFPLELQFRVAMNQVLLALGQVGNMAPPLDADSYTSFAQIRERIAAIAATLAAADPATWASPEDTVDLTLPNGVRFVMSAAEDIRDWILPNFYFHVTMAYALLRREGVTLGKMDFVAHMACHRIECEP